MNTRTCRNCEQIFKLKKRRGTPSAFCSVSCREQFNKQYHHDYDAQPDQLARRREYMKGYRNPNPREKKSPLMRDQPKTKAKKKLRREAREQKTRDLVEGHEKSRQEFEEYFYEPEEPGDQS